MSNVVVYGVKGPDGLSPNLLCATKIDAQFKMLAIIHQHKDGKETKEIASQYSVVPVQLVELNDMETEL